MKRLSLIAPLVLGASLAQPAFAQNAGIAQPVETGHTVLTVQAEGTSTRTPDIASFSAGVTNQAATASGALKANSAQMTQVIAALKRAGIADKDIQTSNLNLNLVYAPPKRLPDGSFEDQGQRIVGYQANNTVSVRARKLDDMGKVIDALVGAGANQVNGPNFMLSQPDGAEDEARLAAMSKAQARAALYAKAAGLRVVRILSISEGGGYRPPAPLMYAKAAMATDSAPPVAAGELETNVSVNVQFELAP